VFYACLVQCSFGALFKTTLESDGRLCGSRKVKYAHFMRFLKEAHMAEGTVKWFNAQKGFGFIEPTSGGKDVFLHISAVERAGLSTVNEGQKVTYDVVNERGKDAASNLKVA
jgi:CspA family cold shock protein